MQVKIKEHLLGTSTHNSIHAKVLVEEHAATYIYIYKIPFQKYHDILLLNSMYEKCSVS